MSAVPADRRARSRGGRFALPGGGGGAAAFAAVGLLGLERGGYFATTWCVATVAVLTAGILAALRTRAVQIDASFLIPFTGLVVWTAIEAARPGAATLAMPELQRSVLYLAAVWAAGQLIGARGVPTTLFGVCAASSALLLDGLAHVLDPVHITADAFEGRLLFLPLGYANACGVLAAVAILLAVDSSIARAAAATALVPLAVALALTQSRAAVLALVVGSTVTLCLHPRRRALGGRMAILFPLPIAAAVLTAHSHVADAQTSASTVAHDCVVVAAATALFSLLQLLLATQSSRRLELPTIAVALPAVLAAGAAAVVAVRGVGARAAYWQVAWQDARAHPLLGSGPGTFAREWLAHRTTASGALNAHNLYLETLAELGPLGLALLLAALAAPLVAAARRRSAVGAVGAGAYATFLLHAALDWDWQLPAVTVAGLVCGVSTLRAATVGNVPSRRSLQPVVALASIAALAAAVAGIGDSALAAAARSGTSPGAARAARLAAALQPWSAEPRRRLAELALARGDRIEARRLLVQALRLDPRDASAWYDLGVAGTPRERALAARRLERLDPLAVRVNGSVSWQIVDAGTPAGVTSYESSAVGMDGAGDVVANSTDGAQLHNRAFVFFKGRRLLLPALGGRRDVQTDATAVDGAGDVVGSSTTARGDDHAVLWRDGKAIDLGALAGGHLSEADAIAPNGDIAGRSTTRTVQHAVLWRDGKRVDLGPPPTLPGVRAPNAIVEAINDADEVVGSSEDEFFGHATAQRAFRSAGGRLVPLTPPQTESEAVDVNSSGEIVGSYTLPSGVAHACLWRGGTLVDLGTLPGTVASRAVAINDAGVVVGISSDAHDSHEAAFVWRDGTMTALGTLGGDQSSALAIDETGFVVGMSMTSSGATHAFAWHDGTMTDLGALAGGQSRATAVDDAGRIAGVSRASRNRDHAVVWIPNG